MEEEIKKQIEIPEGYERLVKGEKWGLLQKRTISITSTNRITFSRDLGKLLNDFYGVEIFINRKKKKILIIPSNDGVVAQKLTRPSDKSKAKWNRNSYSSFCIFSKAFGKENIKSGIWSVRWNLGRIEFDYTSDNLVRELK